MQPEKPAAAATTENKPLLAALKGLYFLDDAKKIVKQGVSGDGLAISNSLAIRYQPEVVQQLKAFLGQPLGTADLPHIKAVIVEWYRAHDLPVVDVAFPSQDISGGTLQAVVTVYKLGKVKVEGNQWFSDRQVASPMHLAAGQPIDFSLLKQDLNLMNRNPFRKVNAVLERSAAAGAADLVLKTEDRFPLRVYASFDNNGLPVTGRDQYSIGFNWGNAFFQDHQLSYRLITSPDLWRSRDRGAGHSDDPRLVAHSFIYQAPLGWGDGITVFGSYVQQVPNLGPYFDQVGHSTQFSLRYDGGLPAVSGRSQQLQFGFDYKRTDNNLAFGGTQIFTSATVVEQFSIAYDLTCNDAWGQTALQNSFYYSPGGWADGNTTARFVAAGVTGAKATYAYDNLQITRINYLPWQITNVVRLNAQWSNVDLLPSEQLGAGGSDSVRGYDPRAASASQGVLASFELRSPAISPLQRLGWDVDDSAQLLAFSDNAFLVQLHHQTSAPNRTWLNSVGFGLRYAVDRFIDVRFDHGWQLSKVTGAASRNSLSTVSITLAY